MHRQDLQTSPNHENYCTEAILTIEPFSMEIDSLHQNIFKDIYQTTAALGTPFVGKHLGRQHKALADAAAARATRALSTTWCIMMLHF